LRALRAGTDFASLHANLGGFVRPFRACVALLALALAAPAAAFGNDEAPERPDPSTDAARANPARAPETGIREALTCWRRLVRVDTPSDHEGQAARSAVDRLFATSQGLALVEALCGLFVDVESDALRITIQVSFVDHLPCRDGTDGCFRPSVPGADIYEVFVRTQYPKPAHDPSVFVFGEYPSNPECSVVFFYQEASSSMAQALYHELLHVWFVNAHAHEHRDFPTGHGSVTNCEFEDDFLELLRAHAAALAVLEGRAPKPLRRARSPHTDRP
jgi:hypothetical protein